MSLDDPFFFKTRSTGFDSLLENTDRSSKHTVMNGKQMYHITFQVALSATGSVTQFIFTRVTECNLRRLDTLSLYWFVFYPFLTVIWHHFGIVIFDV